MPNFEKGTKKMSAWGRLKECLPHIFAWGWMGDGVGRGCVRGSLLCFFSKKRLLKIKCGFNGSISNVDLGLFKPNKQLMISFIIFWFC